MEYKYSYVLLSLVSIILLLQGKVFCKNLVVANYNLWNVMFQWDIRKYYIADMIREANPDIIGFQEVRADVIGKRNQLHDLQKILPQYKYSSFHFTTTVNDRFGANSLKGWEKEGIGVLSKHSIVVSHQIPLSKANSNDQTPRSLLHVQIQYDMHEIFFIVAHFSTDQKLQCQSAMRMINFIASTGADRTIIVGDFNTYVNYEWPVDAIQSGFFLPNGCPSPKGFEPMSADQGYGFDDSWVETNADQLNLGLTFSNMPLPGLINRPDRILVSHVGLHPVKTTLLGNGIEYKRRYSTSSYLSRLRTINFMAKLQWEGHQLGYSCAFDCGPHGACRCGVCVDINSQQPCSLPSCDECSAEQYNIVLLLYYFSCLFVIFIIYMSMGIYARHAKKRQLLKVFLFTKWFRCKHLIAFVLIGLAIFYTLLKTSLSAMFVTAFNRIPEEMFPSDHLMVVSEIQLTYH